MTRKRLLHPVYRGLTHDKIVFHSSNVWMRTSVFLYNETTPCQLNDNFAGIMQPICEVGMLCVCEPQSTNNESESDRLKGARGQK